MMLLKLTVHEWDVVWATVASQLLRDFMRADREEEALEIWNRARVLEAVRTQLAHAVAGDDAALVTALNPINPYQSVQP